MGFCGKRVTSTTTPWNFLLSSATTHTESSETTVGVLKLLVVLLCNVVVIFVFLTKFFFAIRTSGGIQNKSQLTDELVVMNMDNF